VHRRGVIVGKKMIFHLLIRGAVNNISRADGEYCVAIWQRTHDCLSSDIAASARPVLNDELLTKPLGEPLTYYARDDVNRLARGKSDDNAHRPRRIALRSRDARDSRENGGARCQMQKISAGEVYVSPRPALLYHPGNEPASLMRAPHFCVSDKSRAASLQAWK